MSIYAPGSLPLSSFALFVCKFVLDLAKYVNVIVIVVVVVVIHCLSWTAVQPAGMSLPSQPEFQFVACMLNTHFLSC